VKDGDGNLVNAAGFTLMGYDYTGGTPAPVVNGFDGLVPVKCRIRQPDRDAIDHGRFSPQTLMTARRSSRPQTCRPPTRRPRNTPTRARWWSMTTGWEVLLDFYYTKTAANTWEVAVYDRADATPTTSFPLRFGCFGHNRH
jgi:flagellar hook protein FlgE